MNDVKEELTNEELKVQRPWPITIVCVIGFLSSLKFLLIILILLFMSDGPAAKSSSEGNNLLVEFLIIFCFYFFGFLSYWKMQKWGVIICSIILIYYIGHSIQLGKPFNLQYFFLWLTTVGVGMFYYKRMR